VDTPEQTDPSAATSPSPTETALAKLCALIVDGAVGSNDQFVDFTDSISALEYVNSIKETFQVEVPITALYGELSTIAKLAEMIEQKTAAASRARNRRSEPNPRATVLPGGEWQVWNTVALRGAGFPVDLVTEFMAPRSAAAADAYLEARRAVVAARVAALRELSEAIRRAPLPERSKLRGIRRHLKHDRLDIGLFPGLGSILERSLRARDAAYATYVDAYELENSVVFARAAAMLDQPRFREAVIWQNRHALDTVPRKLTDGTVSSGDRRNAAAFVAMLAQRYAVKNDSIGFFGPVGWSELTRDDFVVRTACGPDLLERRQVYFEGWAIDEVAEKFNREPGIRRWLCPRVLAGVWLSAEAVFLPIGGEISVSPRQRQVLELCDGTKTPQQIATALGLPADPDVFDTLTILDQLKLIGWKLEVAPQLFPERELAAKIALIDDAGLRQRLDGDLQSLTAARDRVAAAAGVATDLNAEMAHLETTFERITGSSASRRAGQMYAGRGVVFEDCRRDCDVKLGARFLERLGPPLSIVLDAAHWVSAALRQQFTDHLRRSYAELRSAGGVADVDAHLFLNHVGRTARAALAPMSDAVRIEYRNRWRRMLDVTPDARAITLTAADARARAGQLFETSAPSSWGDYFTPDVMVQAESRAAFEEGRYTCVLGEIHSNNNLLWSALVSQHPRPELLREALESDTRGTCTVVIQTGRDRWLSRLNPMTLPSFLRYEYGDSPASLPGCIPMPAGRLVVADDGSKVVVRARDGGVSFDAYELFAVTMSYEADRIVPDRLPPGKHSPRVRIGDLTINREQWYVDAGTMQFLSERDARARFWMVRQWAASLGMPRYVFYKSPGETKPCYLDFDSPLFVDVFVKLLRRLRRTKLIRITEMSPSVDETWLEDANGAHYTSEIRLAAKPAYLA
jgi:acyl carrier protein